MRSAKARQVRPDDDVFARVGEFLRDNGLPPDPTYYAFGHRIVTNPDSDVARTVARLTDNRVRLSRHDIEALGLPVPGSEPRGRASSNGGADERAEKLVAQTQAQVDDFATMMRAMQDETRGFGRDLAESAAAMSARSRLDGLDEVAQITTTMLARVRDAEVRLAKATEETDALRTKLKEANDTARRDPLTGLPNRRAFDEAFASRSEADGPHCVAVCDVDRFKRINDNFGHGVGDRVLNAIAHVLSEECAPHLVVRHGGEEFAVLLSGTDLTRATETLDHARAVTATKRFRSRDTHAALGQITFSAGITAIKPGETQEEACERADRLLYAAKAAGRDRIHAG